MKQFKNILIIIILTIVLLPLTTRAQDNTTEEGLDYVPGEILIKFKTPTTESNKLVQEVTNNRFIASNDLEKKEDIEGTDISVIKITDNKTVKEKVAELSSDPTVEYVEPNYIRHPASINTNDTYKDLLWALDNQGKTINGYNGILDADMDAPEAWGLSDGSKNPIIVADIDTGVAYNHPDLAANMWDGTNCLDDSGNFLGNCNHGYNYQNNNKSPLPGFDTQNVDHGTHISGMIAAIKNNSKGVIGLAPNAKIMAIKTDLSVAQEVKAINFAIKNGAKIINASWGSSSYSQTEYDAINLFKQSGGLWIAAAGNNSRNLNSVNYYPAGYDLDNIIAVAATDAQDRMCYYSNYGPTFVDVGAPGDNVYSTSVAQARIPLDYGTTTIPNVPDSFTKGGTNNNWGTKKITSFLYNSEKVLTANLSHPYATSSNSTLTSSAYNFSNVAGAKISFETGCDTEYVPNVWNDYMTLEISSDDFNTFTELLKWDEADLDKRIGSGINVAGGAIYHFYDVSVPAQYLTSNFKYRLRWVANGNENVGNGGGCWVDDFEMLEADDGLTEQYSYKGGTSMSTAYVSGETALIWGTKPSLSATEVKNLILNTGDSVTALSGNTLTGKRVNAFKALNSIIANSNVTYSDSDKIVKNGDSLTITANFTEPIADAPPLKINISGANTVEAADMTKISSSTYSYTYTVTSGDGTSTVSFSNGLDVSGNNVVAMPISGGNFTVDNTAPIISISSPSTLLTKHDPVSFLVNYEKADLITLSASDINLITTGTATGNVSVLETSTTTRTVIIDNISGDGSIGISLNSNTASDLASNISLTASSSNFTVDNTAPINQDSIFNLGTSVKGASLISVSASVDASDNLWFALEGTTNFLESATSTRGTSTSILAPEVEGNYRLFVIDAIGNISLASNAVLTVDNTPVSVSKLGDGSVDFTIAPGNYNLSFSEELSSSSKENIQKAISNGADKALTYSWLNNVLAISVTTTTTFANDVMAEVSDIAGNISELLLIDSSLLENQNTPNESGSASINNITSQTVIVNPIQEVTINIDNGTNDPTINLKSFIENGSGSLPQISINSNIANIIIPASNITSASTTWNGIMSAPKVTTVDLPFISGETKSLSSAIELGFNGGKLSFDKAVRITMPGQAGKRVGYTRSGEAFTEITNICTLDNQATGDALAIDSECKTTSGSDLIIWTKHFTTFATYTQTTDPVKSSSGGGGGGGGISAIYCTTVNYSDWNNICSGAMQFRKVISSSPSGCSLSATQQVATQRVCQLTTGVIINQPVSTTATSTNQVTTQEQKLTTKIDTKLIKKLAGRILLQTETKGQAWYLDIVSLKRYYLADGPTAYLALRKFGLGITNTDLSKIPVAKTSALPTNYIKSTKYSTSLTNKLKGRIVIQTENHGEAWYINPTDGKRYYLANGEAAYQIMRNLSLGISNINIRKIGVGNME